MKMNDKFWAIRNYQPDDFDNYVQLQLETEKRDQSGQYISKQLIEETLGHPSFHPATDLFLAEAGQELVGCVSVFLEPGIGRALLDGRVHPLYRRKGIASDLFGHAVGYAKRAGIKAAQISIPQTNLAAQKMLSGLGLGLIRHFLGYKLDLSTIQLPDITAGDYIFRSLQAGEAPQLTAIQNRSFADTWGFNANTCAEIAYRINSSSCRPENIIMVYRADRPVGYCWTRIFPAGNSTQAEKKGEIHMLGVDPDFRQQSIGKKVLTAGLSYLKLKGVDIVELTADAEMPAALALYESAGFTRYLTVNWYEKKL
jgi:mycothiol synthase